MGELLGFVPVRSADVVRLGDALLLYFDGLSLLLAQALGVADGVLAFLLGVSDQLAILRQVHLTPPMVRQQFVHALLRENPIIGLVLLVGLQEILKVDHGLIPTL
jgi:hypothetical protein